MASEKNFLHKALDDYAMIEYLSKSLDRAGVSSVSVQRTPIATRITMLVQKPGMVVGKRGAGINEIVEDVKSKFGVENPQIEVLEVAVPSLDPKLVAQKIGKQIELRGNMKQVMRMTLQDIMGAGALGAEIRVAGKIVGKGGKAKTLAARKGFLKKSGESKRMVSEAHYTSYPKAGAIGITVKILPPGAYMAEKIDVNSLKFPEKVAAQAQVAAPSAAAETPQSKEASAEKPAAEKVAAPKKRVSKKKAASAPADTTETSGAKTEAKPRAEAEAKAESEPQSPQ